MYRAGDSAPSPSVSRLHFVVKYWRWEPLRQVAFVDCHVLPVDVLLSLSTQTARIRIPENTGLHRSVF